MTQLDPATVALPPSPGRFVAHSELRVPSAGAPELIAAFRHRLGEVEAWPGFERLEVWQDERDDGRIPSGPDAPRPVSFARFRVVAR